VTKRAQLNVEGLTVFCVLLQQVILDPVSYAAAGVVSR
jgi:hypothetical protein